MGRRFPADRPQEKRAYSQGKTTGFESRSLLEEGSGAQPCELGEVSKAEKEVSLGGRTTPPPQGRGRPRGKRDGHLEKEVVSWEEAPGLGGDQGVGGLGRGLAWH